MPTALVGSSKTNRDCALSFNGGWLGRERWQDMQRDIQIVRVLSRDSRGRPTEFLAYEPARGRSPGRWARFLARVGRWAIFHFVQKWLGRPSLSP